MGAYKLIEAINFVLIRSNETPINSLSDDSSSASTLAKNFLENERLAVLGEGLQFNTRISQFNPNTNGNILFGDNILSIDGSRKANNRSGNEDNKFAIVNSKLWDVEKQSDVFDDSVTLEVYYDIPFNEMPTHIQYRIMTRTAVSFLSQFSADESQLRDLVSMAQRARVEADQKELNSDNTSMLTKSALGKLRHSRFFNRFRG